VGDRVRIEDTADPAVGVTDDGANWNVSPAGNPETLRLTADLKPFSGITLIIALPEAPCVKVSVGTETPI